jgi:hypothetical protein
MHPMFYFPNIVFKYRFALMLYSLYTYIFVLNATYYLVTLLAHVSPVYGLHQVSSILLKLLHCMLKFRIACERDIS